MFKLFKTKENVVEVLAYAPSVNECKNYNAKFPSLAVKKVSENAINCGAFEFTSDEDYKGNGYFYTRTLVAGSASKVFYVRNDGKIDRTYSDSRYAGACVALTTIYDPESKFVKSVKKRDFTRVVYKEGKGRVEVTDKNVPIVKFGDYEYIWYNKEECESGESPLMDLVILDMPECAVPIVNSEEGLINGEYSNATEQHEQYKRIALQGASDEEKKLLVLMRFTPDDDYEHGTPVYTKEQKKIIEKVKENFEPEN